MQISMGWELQQSDLASLVRTLSKDLCREEFGLLNVVTLLILCGRQVTWRGVPSAAIVSGLDVVEERWPVS